MRAQAPTPAPVRPHRTALLLLGGLAALGLAALVLAVGAVTAHAQFAGAKNAPPSQPVSKNEPVYYQADHAAYDRDSGIVTLSGHVEIWQGARDLRADTVTYDRNTGVVAASGHVVLLDPDGQVVFGDYAELASGMKDGIIKNMRAQLAENGHLAANGGRRIDARVNEFSRAIYSTCDACKKDPTGPLLWDMRARSAIQDLDNKRIEYRDAVVDMYGIPVMYFPYFTQPDPSQKRASGFLVPSFGDSKYLGLFADDPYFWAIDPSTDATITPIVTTKNGPALQTEFRHAFNDGTVTIDASAAYDEQSAQGAVLSHGAFTLNDEWRWGFDVNRASSVNYMRDYSIEGEPEVLTSDVYLEGFGQGSYSRVDVTAYQGLIGEIVTARLPYVLPRYQYDFVGEPDALGGRSEFTFGAFNVLRSEGTSDQRTNASYNWERPFTGQLGDLWKLAFHVDAAAYHSIQLDQSPTFGALNSADAAQGMPSVSVQLNWPFERDGGSWGTQVIEPIVQLIGAPDGSSYGLDKPLTTSGTLNTRFPNEDSLDFEFTDANLFSLNRFSGIDRLEGGTRANVGLHTAWYFPDGQQLDGLVGQGYRTHTEKAFPFGSGLDGTETDIVDHLSYVPNKWIDFTTRQRWDHDSGQLRFADTVATGGPTWLRLTVGDIYSVNNPYLYYDTTPTQALVMMPRDELTVGATTTWGHWKATVNARQNLAGGGLVSLGAGGTYEDECFIFNVSFNRRYTSINGDDGDTTLLFTITFKTVGTFGFSSL